MKRRNTYVGLILLLAVLMLGIGYAAMSNIPLTINGSAGAIVDDENFKVKFTEPITKDDTVTETSIAADGHTATFKVEGLKAKGDTATVTYTILNDSADLSAAIAVTAATTSNTEYFSVTAAVKDAVVTAKNTTTVTVTVKLEKTPIDNPVSDENITVSLTATPEQPTDQESQE